MTLEELGALLETTTYDVAFHHFDSKPSLPFVVYLADATDNFGADNKVYYKVQNCRVELYNRYKDLTAEKKVEDLFNENEIFYKKDETYIESEELYEVIYYISL